MPHKKQKEKSIVEHLNDDIISKYKLVPNLKLGEFKFDTPISDYLAAKSYSFYKDSNDSLEGYYTLIDTDFDIYVDKLGIITHITCEKYCTLNGRNLIGQQFESFDFEPTVIEKIWVNKNGVDIIQTVYDVDYLGLQIWTYRRKIVTVICSNLNDVPNAS